MSLSTLIYSIEEIEYDMYVIEPLIRKFLEWLEYSFHTFPKTIKAWTNLIYNDYSTFKFELTYKQLFALKKSSVIAKLVRDAIREGTYKALPDRMFITINTDPKLFMVRLMQLGILVCSPFSKRVYVTRAMQSQKSSLIMSPLCSFSSRYLLSSV